MADKAAESPFDLIVAADVLIYMGDLSGVFTGVTESLSQWGLFALTLELPTTDEMETLELVGEEWRWKVGPTSTIHHANNHHPAHFVPHSPLSSPRTPLSLSLTYVRPCLRRARCNPRGVSRTIRAT